MHVYFVNASKYNYLLNGNHQGDPHLDALLNYAFGIHFTLMSPMNLFPSMLCITDMFNLYDAL